MMSPDFLFVSGGEKISCFFKRMFTAKCIVPSDRKLTSDRKLIGKHAFAGVLFLLADQTAQAKKTKCQKRKA